MSRNKINCQRALLLSLQSCLTMPIVQADALKPPVQVASGTSTSQTAAHVPNLKADMHDNQLPEFIDVARTIKGIIDSDVVAPTANALANALQLSPVQLSAFLDKVIDSLKPKIPGNSALFDNDDTEPRAKSRLVISS